MKNTPLEAEKITCSCNENCGEGHEGEVNGHIEDCSCGHCHALIGKVSPFMEIN